MHTAPDCIRAWCCRVFSNCRLVGDLRVFIYYWCVSMKGVLHADWISLSWREWCDIFFPVSSHLESRSCCSYWHLVTDVIALICRGGLFVRARVRACVRACVRGCRLQIVRGQVLRSVGLQRRLVTCWNVLRLWGPLFAYVVVRMTWSTTTSASGLG